MPELLGQMIRISLGELLEGAEDLARGKAYAVPIDQVKTWEKLLTTVNTLYKAPVTSELSVFLSDGKTELHPLFWESSVTPGESYIVVYGVSAGEDQAVAVANKSSLQTPAEGVVEKKISAESSAEIVKAQALKNPFNAEIVAKDGGLKENIVKKAAVTVKTEETPASLAFNPLREKMNKMMQPVKNRPSPVPSSPPAPGRVSVPQYGSTVSPTIAVAEGSANEKKLAAQATLPKSTTGDARSIVEPALQEDSTDSTYEPSDSFSDGDVRNESTGKLPIDGFEKIRIAESSTNDPAALTSLAEKPNTPNPAINEPEALSSGEDSKPAVEQKVRCTLSEDEVNSIKDKIRAERHAKIASLRGTTESTFTPMATLNQKARNAIFGADGADVSKGIQKVSPRPHSVLKQTIAATGTDKKAAKPSPRKSQKQESSAGSSTHSHRTSKKQEPLIDLLGSDTERKESAQNSSRISPKQKAQTNNPSPAKSPVAIDNGRARAAIFHLRLRVNVYRNDELHKWKANITMERNKTADHLGSMLEERVAELIKGQRGPFVQGADSNDRTSIHCYGTITHSADGRKIEGDVTLEDLGIKDGDTLNCEVDVEGECYGDYE